MAEQTREEIMLAGENYAAKIAENPIVEGLVKQMKKKIDNGLSLPPDYDVQSALLSAYLKLKETTDKSGKCILDTCSNESVALALLDMATAGLDVQKAQCYPIAYGGKLSFQKSYFGWMTLARRCGVIRFTRKCIYAGDDFSYDIINGDYANIVHKQSFGNVDKDKIIGAYAIAFFLDGSSTTEVMTIDEIRRSWKMNRQNSGNGNTHKEYTRQMAEKTVLSKLCRSIANSYGNKYVFESASMDENFEETMEDAGDIVVEGVKQEIAENANKVEFVDEFEILDASDVEVVE